MFGIGSSEAPFGPKTLARAMEVRAAAGRVLDAVKAEDNKGGDNDSRAGEVSLSNADNGRSGLTASGLKPYAEFVKSAQLSFDPQGGRVKRGSAECEYWLDNNNPNFTGGGHDTFTLTPTNWKGREAVQVDYKRDAYRTLFGEYSSERVVSDAKTGELLSYKGSEYHQTFGSALKEMVTTPAGIGLTAFAGLLFGLPGTLTGTLFGPLAGVVAAGACIGGFAAYKTKPWTRALPYNNE